MSAPLDPPVAAWLASATSAVTTAAADRYRTTLYSRTALDAAAAPVADLWVAGERHGITPADWAAVTSLPAAALDVTANRYRNQIPHTGDAAADALEGVAARLRERGATVRHTRNGLLLSVEPVEATPRWVDGGGRLVLTVHPDTGWYLELEVGGTAITIVAPFDDAGAGVADVVNQVNGGIYGSAVFAG